MVADDGDDMDTGGGGVFEGVAARFNGGDMATSGGVTGGVSTPAGTGTSKSHIELYKKANNHSLHHQFISIQCSALINSVEIPPHFTKRVSKHLFSM